MRYSVTLDAKVRVAFHDVLATSPREAQEIAMEMFERRHPTLFTYLDLDHIQVVSILENKGGDK